MTCPELCLAFAVWDLSCKGGVQLGKNSCISTGVAEDKNARRYGSIWISAFNLRELWFARATFEGEQSRNDGGTDIVWLHIKVANPQLFHTDG